MPTIKSLLKLKLKLKFIMIWKDSHNIIVRKQKEGACMYVYVRMDSVYNTCQFL